MIFIIIFVSILLIVWLQSPYIKNDEKLSLPINIYNKAKLPLVISSLFGIVYILCKNENIKIDQKIYCSLPNF
jgi:hypothetical protein